MAKLANSMAEIENFHPQEKKSNLEDVVVELAKSKAELARSQAQFMDKTRANL